MNEKEYLYIGYYVDTNGKYILKIGTTNDLKRRQAEHTRNYKRAKMHTLPQDSIFQYIWHLKLSKYNTLRYEDKNRKRWQDLGIGEFVRNDRFILHSPIEFVEIVIRKTYKVALNKGNFFVQIAY